MRRVVLYKNGIGYFEHTGRVVGDQDVSLSFTSAQLDDALKSLTALDLDGGQIGGINYNSTAPLAQRLGGVGLNLGDVSSAGGFFGSLQGARIDVRNKGNRARGRLLSVEARQSREPGEPDGATTVLSVIDDRGTVRSVEVSGASTVRLLDADLADRIGQYLTVTAGERSRDERRVTISSRGTGTRNLYVSYTSEVPAWKATYRLLMPDAARRSPLLQGWAIVDNTVGEDWSNVELALVAGAPQSFVLRLSQPQYIRRPVVSAPGEAQSDPQRHGRATVTGEGALRGVARDREGAVLPGVKVYLLDSDDDEVETAVTDARGAYAFDPDAGSYRVRFELAGFVPVTSGQIVVRPGMITTQDMRMAVAGLNETVTVTGEAPTIDTAVSRVEVADRMAGIVPIAQASALGDLFEYRIKDPVTVRRNQSALVPILQATVDAERVSIWNESLGRSRPLRAVWMTNTSHLTLDGGSFTVLDEGVFAGEGLLDPIKPGERRLLSYAHDLGVSVDPKEDEDQSRLARLRTSEGFLIEQRETCGRRTYTIRNDDVTPRAVVVEHPVRSNWALAADSVPVETTSSVYRFRVGVAPRSTATLVVNEANMGESRFRVSDLTPQQIEYYVRSRALDAASAQGLAAVVDQRSRVAGFSRERASREAEASRIRDEQKRLRENIAALKASVEERRLVQRYVQQLDRQEDRLIELAREAQQLRVQEATAQGDLDRRVHALALEFAAAPGAACSR